MGTFLAAVLMAPSVAAAQAVADTKPVWRVPSDGSGWIAFAPSEDGHVIIPVTLNGAPAMALVDTGFENMTLAKRYADAHHLPLRFWGSPLSVGGRTPFYLTGGVNMTVGDVRMQTPSTFVVVDLGKVGTGLAVPIDIVIGLDLLAHVAWEIDENEHRFRLMPSGALLFSHPGSIRPGPEGARLVTDVRVGRAGTVLAMIDTGAQTALAITPDVAHAAGGRVLTDIAGAGPGGATITQIVSTGSIVVGGEQVSDMVVEQAGVETGLTQIHIPAVLGMDLLGRYRLRMDPPSGLFQLDPRTNVPAVAKSTSGVQGGVTDDRLTIVHVMLNSPAQASGLKAGDAICGVNGWTAVEADALHWGRAAPGTRYTIHLCDGRTVPLVTRAFY